MSDHLEADEATNGLDGAMGVSQDGLDQIRDLPVVSRVLAVLRDRSLMDFSEADDNLKRGWLGLADGLTKPDYQARRPANGYVNVTTFQTADLENEADQKFARLFFKKMGIKVDPSTEAIRKMARSGLEEVSLADAVPGSRPFMTSNGLEMVVPTRFKGVALRISGLPVSSPEEKFDGRVSVGLMIGTKK